MKRNWSILFIAAFLFTGQQASGQELDISNNYWGDGIVPPSSYPDYTHWINYHFISSSVESKSTSNWTCGSNGSAAKPKDVTPLSIADNSDTCSVGFPVFVSELITNGQYRQGYDTMRYWYIPHCYPIANPGQTAGALAGAGQIGSVLTTYDSVLSDRNFVIHCLTLRKDDAWFCAFVADLTGDFVDSNNIYSPDYRAQRTISQYLMNNPRCASGRTGD